MLTILLFYQKSLQRSLVPTSILTSCSYQALIIRPRVLKTYMVM
nr:MAG TPA: hypothetical protein [Caudoviricetes sp.]